MINTAIEARVKAAGAEMKKPGCWRIAYQQLLQATDQLLADPESDRETARLALDNLQALYAWASVMRPDEFQRLNAAVFALQSSILGL